MSCYQDKNIRLTEKEHADDWGSNFPGLLQAAHLEIPVTTGESGIPAQTGGHLAAMPQSKVVAIGIDVGTTKCCVAAVRDGRVEVFENERGKKVTPSVVAFTESMRLVGDDAKDQWTMNHLNTVSGIKKIIGRSYHDLCDAGANLHCVVNEGGKPFIAVTYKDKPMKLLPEQILAMLLVKMKQIAEFNLGYQVNKAVISVPSGFDENQRQATIDAGAIAGLEVLELINEVTAAAITYRDNRGNCEENLLVIDFGGGTLDSGVVRIDGNNVDLVNVFEGQSIGGDDLDNLLANHFAEEFAREKRLQVSDNVKSMTKLRLKCEPQKHNLSLLPAVKIQIDCLINDVDLSSSITRDRFQNDVCRTYLRTKLFPALDNAMHNSDVSRVLLIGGSTRIPFVQKHLRDAGKILDKTVNLDEAVAHGAALRAALLAGDNSVRDLMVRDGVGKTVQVDDSKLTLFIDQENEFKRDEEEERMRTVAMNDLERYCLASNNDNLRVEVLDWMYDNPSASKDMFLDKQKLFKKQSLPVESFTSIEYPTSGDGATAPGTQHSTRTTTNAQEYGSINKERDDLKKGSDRRCCNCSCILL